VILAHFFVVRMSLRLKKRTIRLKARIVLPCMS
jgi:hypothetical protein